MPPCSAIFERSFENINDFKGGYQNVETFKDLLVSPHPGRDESPGLSPRKNEKKDMIPNFTEIINTRERKSLKKDSSDKITFFPKKRDN